MSWKIDLAALGALAVGGYFVFVNLDKIMGWLGTQVFGGVEAAQEAYAHAGENVGATIGGMTTGPTGKAVGAAIGSVNQSITGSPIVGGVSGAIAGTIWPMFVQPEQPKPTPAPTRDASPAEITPFPNPVASIPGATPFPTTPQVPASTPTPSYSASQMSEAQSYISQPGVTSQYVQTFADPGSPAWIAAQSAGLI